MKIKKRDIKNISNGLYYLGSLLIIGYLTTLSLININNNEYNNLNNNSSFFNNSNITDINNYNSHKTNITEILTICLAAVSFARLGFLYIKNNLDLSKRRNDIEKKLTKAKSSKKEANNFLSEELKKFINNENKLNKEQIEEYIKKNLANYILGHFDEEVVNFIHKSEKSNNNKAINYFKGHHFIVQNHEDEKKLIKNTKLCLLQLINFSKDRIINLTTKSKVSSFLYSFSDNIDNIIVPFLISLNLNDFLRTTILTSIGKSNETALMINNSFLQEISLHLNLIKKYLILLNLDKENNRNFNNFLEKINDLNYFFETESELKEKVQNKLSLICCKVPIMKINKNPISFSLLNIANFAILGAWIKNFGLSIFLSKILVVIQSNDINIFDSDNRKLSCIINNSEESTNTSKKKIMQYINFLGFVPGYNFFSAIATSISSFDFLNFNASSKFSLELMKKIFNSIGVLRNGFGAAFNIFQQEVSIKEFEYVFNEFCNLIDSYKELLRAIQISEEEINEFLQEFSKEPNTSIKIDNQKSSTNNIT